VAPALTPAVIFLPLGVVLGPQVLGLITPRLVERLDFVVTLGLAVLGVLVGLATGREMRSATRLFVAASLESLVTTAAVTGAVLFFVTETGVPLHAPALAFAIALGLSASASSATSADPDSEPAAGIATRVADLDDVLPILISVVAFSLLPIPGGGNAWMFQLAPVALGLIVGGVGWLLFERSESGAERAVFVLGTLALAGGSAAYVGVSPLAVGLVSGLVWTLLPGRADVLVRDDLRMVQHPVVVLLLVAAGAMTTWSAAAAWLLTPYLLFRLSGKVIGAWLSSRIVDVGAADLTAYLMPPGVLAVALALNFRQVLPAAAGDTLLSTVAIGTAAFEIFALAVLPHWRRGSTG
jgi:hypothetical protein